MYRPGANNTRVVVIDDHPLVSSGVCAAIAEIGLCAFTFDPQPQLEIDERDWATLDVPAAEVAVVDVTMGSDRDAGVRFVRWLTKAGIDCVVYTGSDDSMHWDACIASGASTVISKGRPIKDLVRAVEATVRGEVLTAVTHRAQAQTNYRQVEDHRRQQVSKFSTLTEREQVVLRLLCDGHNVRSIAEQGFVAESTVRTQVKSVLRKLDVSSQLEAVAMANGMERIGVFGAAQSTGRL